MDMYSVTVNGITYEVQVEKRGGAQAPAQAPVPVVAAPVSAPQAAPAPAAPSADSGTGEPVTAGAAGKVWKILVAEGDTVKSGDTVVILEAMKMEIPVVSTLDGTVSGIAVSEGSPVEAGDVLVRIG